MTMRLKTVLILLGALALYTAHIPAALAYCEEGYRNCNDGCLAMYNLPPSGGSVEVMQEMQNYCSSHGGLGAYVCGSAGGDYCPDRYGTPGSCGYAHGKQYSSVPHSADALCASGVPTEVTGSGPWSWSCSGSTTAVCSATKCGSTPVACPSTPPNVTLAMPGKVKSAAGAVTWTTSFGDRDFAGETCSATSTITHNGETKTIVATGTFPSTGEWECRASASDVVGGSPFFVSVEVLGNRAVVLPEGGVAGGDLYGMAMVSCGGSTTVPVNGYCGAANGQTYGSAPHSVSALCLSGTPTGVSGVGPWSWVCKGSNGGVDSATCSATPCGDCESLPNTIIVSSCSSHGATGCNLATCSVPVASGGLCPFGYTCTEKEMPGGGADPITHEERTVVKCVAKKNACVVTPPPSTPEPTYSWSADPFPACPSQCNSSTLARSVYCKRDTDGQVVGDDKCSGTKPATTQDCAGDTSLAACGPTEPPPCTPTPGSSNKAIDIYFLSDNTGSMGGVIESVRNKANFILNQLTGGDSRFNGFDFRFAVGSYQGDPVEGNNTGTYYTPSCDYWDEACWRGSGGRGDGDGGGGYTERESPYKLISDFTNNKGATQGAIGQWVAEGGGDRAEANFYAMKQSLDANWRDNAGHIMIWLGDAPSHTETVSESEAINGLLSKGIAVIALNSSTFDAGIDTSDGPYPAGQATHIVNATRGLMASTASMDDNELALYILDSIDTTADTVCPGSPGSTPRPADTYSWVTGTFPACTTGCYDSVVTRDVHCERNRDHATVANSYCPAAAVPPAQKTCPGDNTQPGCGDVCNPKNPYCGNAPPEFDSCFTANAKILMADGTEKNISDIKVGDMVMSFDKTAALDSPLFPARVTHVFLNDPKQTYAFHGVKVTGSHKFLTASGKMKSIEEMTESDSIVMKDGSAIARGEIVEGPIEKVYNFTVDGTHAYVVNGMRVGNMTISPPIPEGVYTEERLKDLIVFRDNTVNKN